MLKIHKTINQSIFGHTKFLRNGSNLVVDKENKKLPKVYWTSKLHKHPSKSKFIVTAPQFSVEYLSKGAPSIMMYTYT